MAGAVFKQKRDVSLRPLEKEDAEFVRNLVQKPEVRKHLGRLPEPMSVEQSEDRIEQITEDDSIIQFIIQKESEPVGTIAIFKINRTYRHAEFGAFMVEPDRHGEGIGTVGLELLLEYAFDELGMHRIAGGYIEGNEASRKVQENFGFTVEGREREYKYRNGEYQDLVRMSLLEDEYYEQ